MPLSFSRSRSISDRLHASMSEEEFVALLAPVPPSVRPLPPRVPAGSSYTSAGLARRLDMLARQGIELRALTAAGAPRPEDLFGNIENLVGFCQVPVGLVGPLRVNGVNAKGDFYIPLATTEGALVASCHRGAAVVSQAGGASVLYLSEGVTRAPGFLFSSIAEAGLFAAWALAQAERFPAWVAETTSHGSLVDIKTTINGPEVTLIFEFTTGDAAGQNMVTLATEAICKRLVAESPVRPRTWYVEANLSGDKKASMLSFLGVRGRKVVAECRLPDALVRRYLRTTPAAMAECVRVSTLGGIQSGAIGVHGHYANPLAALFIACGQDAACVAEAVVGITQMTVDDGGSLHATVSLPNLIVGTVGGGTHLPYAQECLALMQCLGAGTARRFAEICAAVTLAGELSITAALAAGDFGGAHARHRHKL